MKQFCILTNVYLEKRGQINAIYYQMLQFVFLVCSSASWAQILQLLLSNLLFEARNDTKIGPDFLVCRVLKGPEKVLIFYLDI